MSSGLIPAFSVSNVQALRQISIFLSYVVAWPSSSNAITTIAAPSLRISLALVRNASSPSLRLMELTIDLPWAFSRPASMVSQCDESIIRAAFATAGSPEICLTNFSMQSRLSSIASSILMSMMPAPSSICFAATSSPPA